MKKCKSCQKEIDVKAKKCPYCQTDQRSWFARHPILTVFLVLFIFGMVGSAGGSKKSTTTTPTTATTATTVNNVEPTVAPQVEAMKVDALEFATEFDKNQLRAEEKYKNKLVELTAVVKNISEDIVGSPYVSLEPAGGKMFGTSIKCVFKEKSQLTALENDQTVTITGTVNNQSLGIIQLDGCNLVN